jgi:hypothetical protein
MMRLWTQTEPQVEIVSGRSVSANALHLVNKFVPSDAILAQGHRPFDEI